MNPSRDPEIKGERYSERNRWMDRWNRICFITCVCVVVFFVIVQKDNTDKKKKKETSNIWWMQTNKKCKKNVCRCYGLECADNVEQSYE